jgi:tetratricopeptide (TPR) repeat protein/2-polyprenyl-3-methyl-5-hydroxy-6-metoxy-1,4-benzoquinol methylase
MDRTGPHVSDELRQAIMTPAGAAIAIAGLSAAALAHHQAGRLGEAARLYRSILGAAPRHVDSLHQLGVIALQWGRSDVAAHLIGRAIALDGRRPKAHFDFATVLLRLGRLDEAAASYARATELKPDYAEAHMNFAIVLKQQGKLGAAVTALERTLAVRPDYAEAHANLGGALAAQGKLIEAVARYTRALALKPDIAEIHGNLGHLRAELGEFDQAEQHYRHALALKPHAADMHMSLGIVLRKLHRPHEAISCHQRALSLRPDYAEALHNLALVYLTQADKPRALATARRALALREMPETKRLFAQCIRGLVSAPDMEALRGLIRRAIDEPWDRPRLLAQVAANFIKQDERLGSSIRRAVETWPSRAPTRDLFGASGFSAVLADPLLLSLMESAQVSDVALERFLTAVRHGLLDDASSIDASTADDHDMLRFCCALARQCWINEYVFDLVDGEFDQAAALRDALATALRSGAVVPPMQIALMASYFPLLSVAPPDLLLERPWPDAVAALITQQVREPLEERQLASAIPRMTKIADPTSVMVRQQYEENPYPRWVRIEPAGQAVTTETWLRQTYPTAAVDNFVGRDAIDILVAGCGAGQNSIEAARRSAGAQVLAVDLSLSSLAYAQRKTRELGIGNIEYAQADILELTTVGRSFDIIESTGVLHHVADWKAGWRVLLSLLRPGGLMRLGLYSELARADLAGARAFIAAHRYERSTTDIRRCRQDMLACADPISDVAKFQDFFTTSECRDLLFHVEEHLLTLPQIKDFLNENGLKFLGFEIEGAVIEQYRRRFAEDAPVNDLDRWNTFEQENPATFAGMYQFWVQRRGIREQLAP